MNVKNLELVDNERYEFVMNNKIKPYLSDRNLCLFENIPTRFYANYKSIIFKNIIVVKNIVNVETGEESKNNQEIYLYTNWIEQFTPISKTK